MTQLRDLYPAPLKLYLVMDNWPSVHQQPTVLTLMDRLGFQPVFVPTYTPEANPIERLWWKLSEDIISLHRYSGQWQMFQERIRAWLEQFRTASADLLRLTGLSGKKAIAVTLRPHPALPV